MRQVAAKKGLNSPMFGLEGVFVNLSQNIALLFALTFAYGLLLDYFDKQAQNIHFAASGLLFGGVALIGMSIPIDVGDGVFVDGRFVVLAMGAAIAGSRSALIAGGLTMLYRLIIGGEGVPADIGAIFSVLLLGSIMHRYQEQQYFKLSGASLLVLGIGSAAAHNLWFLALPDDALDISYGKLAVTVFTLYPAGIFLLGKLIAHENQRVAQELAVEVERQRLARDLHDSVTQTLFSSNVIAQTLLRTYETQPGRIPQLLQQIYDLNQNAYTEMRVLLLELRPDQLVRNTLQENLQHLIEVMRNRSEKILILNAEDGIVVPNHVYVALYRIAQEALSNAIKHANTDSIKIDLTQSADRVRMEIRDGGKGFDFETVVKGMGLDNMRERAAGIGAEIMISSEPGKGTSVVVIWQLPGKFMGAPLQQ